MSVFSGKNGKVLKDASTVLDVTKWSLSLESNTSRYASSSTGGFKKTVVGTAQGDGSFDFKMQDSGVQVISSGDSCTLKLYENATRFWSVPAKIKNVKRDVDMDSGAEVSGSATFETDGAWTEPS